MANSRVSNGNIDGDALSTLLNPKVLNSLTEENQKVVINTVQEVYNKEKEGGLLGQFLGTNKVNVSMHIALILCIILIVSGFLIKDSDIWDKIFTIIATIVGYIFGITQKEN